MQDKKKESVSWSVYAKWQRDIQKQHDEENELEHNRPTWEQTFMSIAKVVAKRSKDPHTKVGAVLVKDKLILSIGYNGEPRNYRLNFDWHSSEKYDYVIHAELNAIANATHFGNTIVGSDIYLTLSPCKDCIKLLIQHGIKNVYYLEEYKDIELVKKIASGSDINLVKMEE